MLRLNSKGFGLATFLFFLGFLILAIVVVAVKSYQVGLSDAQGSIFNTSRDKIRKYKQYEENAKEAAMMYVGENYGLIPYDEAVILNIKDLPLTTIVKNTCSGYVKVNTLIEPPSYRSYLKCESYTTTGYNSEFDK